MKNYNQRNYNQKLGTCGITIAQQGCALTCLSDILEVEPPEINEILKAHNGYTSGCLMNWANLSNIFKVEWGGKTTKPLFYPTIAEVQISKGQHFVIALDDKYIQDPYGGITGKNPYKILSYRNIRLKGGSMSNRTIFFKTDQPDIYKVEHVTDANQVDWNNLIVGGSDVYKIANSDTQLWILPSPKFKQFFKLGDKIKATLYSSCPVCPPQKECPPCPEKDCSKEIQKAFEEGTKSVECPLSKNKQLSEYNSGELSKALWSKFIKFIRSYKKND